MYEIRNGILYRDGRRRIALGQSYYPSFHEKKYPVPPEGAREGIMRADMRAMREAGFNFVRMAAIGDVSRNERGDVEVCTPFIDACVRECAAQDMLPSVRLHGYVMNLSGNRDWMMRNEKDEDMEQDWSAFIRNTLFHEGEWLTAVLPHLLNDGNDEFGIYIGDLLNFLSVELLGLRAFHALMQILSDLVLADLMGECTFFSID